MSLKCRNNTIYKKKMNKKGGFKIIRRRQNTEGHLKNIDDFSQNTAKYLQNTSKYLKIAKYKYS